MSVLMFKVFMIASLMVPAQTLAQHRSISEANLQVAPPSPPKLLPAARLGRSLGIILPTPEFDRTPFSRRVELPLTQAWGGRLALTGFHSNINYSAGSTGDSALGNMRLRSTMTGASSNSYGLRISFSFSRARVDYHPH